jgi:hypothetical protein
MPADTFMFQSSAAASPITVVLTLNCDVDKYGRRQVVGQLGEVQHRDRVNVDVADDRKGFFKLLALKAKLEEAETQLFLAADQRLCALADASDAAAAAERALAEQAAGDPAAHLAEDAVSEDVRAAADRYLHSPQLFQELWRDFGAIGIVGEGVLAATIYLIGTSRLLLQPLSGVVQSASSSGKSHVARKVLGMLPSEDVIIATDLSPTALYYLPPGSLVHKVVFMAERPHADPRDPTWANATLALREIISGGSLDKLVTVKGTDGPHETLHIHQDGPVALLQTTTMVRIFDEDASRLLSLATDESGDQTVRINNFQAMQATGRSPDTQAADDVRLKHQVAQRMLRSFSVRIPYADLISLGTTSLLARRAFPQLMAMIEAVALLRQHQKPQNDGWIDADHYDYYITHSLMAPLLEHKFASLNPQAAELLNIIGQHFGPRGPSNFIPSFTFHALKQVTSSGETTIRGRLRMLVDAGQIDQVTSGRGVPHEFQLTLRSPGSNARLPLTTPRELWQQIAARQQQTTGVAPPLPSYLQSAC